MNIIEITEALLREIEAAENAVTAEAPNGPEWPGPTALHFLEHAHKLAVALRELVTRGDDLLHGDRK